MSIMDVSRARTFCSATAHSLAGLRSAMTTRKNSGTSPPCAGRPASPAPKSAEASATIKHGEPDVARVERIAAFVMLSNSPFHKHSNRNRLLKR